MFSLIKTATFVAMLAGGNGQQISLENGVSGLKTHQPQNLVDLNCPTILAEYQRIRACDEIEEAILYEKDIKKYDISAMLHKELQCDNISSLYPQNYRCGAVYDTDYDTFNKDYDKSPIYDTLCREKNRRHLNLESCQFMQKHPKSLDVLRSCENSNVLISNPCKHRVEGKTASYK